MIYKNALISVSNKEGLVECAKQLSQSGTRIVSTGGTAKFLLKHKIKATHPIFNPTLNPVL